MKKTCRRSGLGVRLSKEASTELSYISNFSKVAEAPLEPRVAAHGVGSTLFMNKHAMCHRVSFLCWSAKRSYLEKRVRSRAAGESTPRAQDSKVVGRRPFEKEEIENEF
jgi:hypothetical protein